MNKIYFENGLNHEFTPEELKLLRFLVAEHCLETAEEHGIDTKAVTTLKTLFFERND